GGRSAMHFRQATSEDYSFLYNLTVVTMKDYVAAIWGWDDAWQQSYFRQNFPNKSWQIIVVEDVDAGAFAVEERPEEIYLANLYVLPDYQGRGIGTEIVRRIQKRAGELGVPVALDVLQSNPKARRLYARLGFQIVGETRERCNMRTGARQPRR
ncbi:MAG TPA: GNAT family N-acetyltransferase, partial [Capsulimonadaceae bacterium]|nr:GNAT family N-acetyltransferase [Capsulimonadaceae bacterium]